MMKIWVLVASLLALVVTWFAIRPRSSSFQTLNFSRFSFGKKKDARSRARSAKVPSGPRALEDVHLAGGQYEPEGDYRAIQAEGEAFSHLENCLRKIEKQFLQAHQEGAPRLLGDTLIDQRVFWDCFRAENNAIVLLYHIDESRVIFSSMSVKRLLGYSPQDFRIRFHECIHDLQAWKKHLYQLRWRKCLYAPIAFKDASLRSGSGICAWDGYLAEIDRGPKSHYAVIVLYPAYCYLPRPALMNP